MNFSFRLFKRCSVFIIGGQKCGTTEFFNVLAQHPQVAIPKIKEVHYFSSEHKYQKGVKWYLKYFPKVPFWKNKVLIEATPSYLFFPVAIRRIQNFNADAKIIILLRDPIDRAYSAWNMFSHSYLKNHPDSPLIDTRSFESAILEELTNEKIKNKHFYVKKGEYADQLESVFEVFRKENVLILQSENYWRNKDFILKKVLDFLNLKGFDFQNISNKLTGKGNYKEAINSNIKDKLNRHYEQFNERLYKMLGEDYKW